MVCRAIEVRGDGLPALWAARAVERVGYRVVSAGEAADIVVVATEEGRRVEDDVDPVYYAVLQRQVSAVEKVVIT